MTDAIEAMEIVYYSTDPARAEAVESDLAAAGFHPDFSHGPEPVNNTGGWTYGGLGADFFRVSVPEPEAARARELLGVAAPARTAPSAPPRRGMLVHFMLLELLLLPVAFLIVAVADFRLDDRFHAGISERTVALAIAGAVIVGLLLTFARGTRRD